MSRVEVPLTGKSLPSSQPPHNASGWCYAGSAGTAGLPLPSCTAALGARSHDPFLSFVYYKKERKRNQYWDKSITGFLRNYNGERQHD